HVAVDDQRAFAKLLEIHDRAQAAPDQTLDFERTPALLAAGRFAFIARAGGTRKHSVFGRDPTRALAFQEGRDLFFDRYGAEHARVTEFDQHGAFGMACEAPCQLDRTQLIGASTGGSFDLHSPAAATPISCRLRPACWSAGSRAGFRRPLRRSCLR